MNNTIKNYYELCKPNVVLMMLITALVGSLLASKTLAPLSLIAFAMLGIALCASSAAAINQIIDRKTDANMNRTENRPIPQGEVSPVNASIFAFILGSLGAAILVIYVNTLTALLTLASLIGYAFVYTVYLKRATPQNIVIGGLAGAAPPLLGWTAVTNSIDPNSLLLVLIIFAWTPPHFWALAIHRKDDYAKENIPMLPVTHGVQFTKLQIILYTIILILVSLLPFVVMMSGILYFISALILGFIFLYYAVRLYFEEDNASAFPTFVYSIYYIFLIFAALLIDHFII
ncbi:heme o synthase [Pseudomonadota bacterium]|jgi:protoheme IX farnesyltransferase|nr:heme o synthase [Pseudomonadota bacterium]|tara:strand:- start:386 stop:1249 length:864 start_codon:yes stop_codon:yes gene_type:complete